MRVLIIGNTEVAADNEDYFGRYVKFLEGAVQGQEDVEVAFTFFDDLHIGVGDGQFIIHDTRHDQPLSDSDVLLLRGGGFRKYYDVIKSISTYAKEHNVLSINDYSGFRDSSKLTQAVQFYREGLPVAHSVYVTEAVMAGKHPLGFDFPCIMKATFGSHGDDNHLVKSMDEVKAIMATAGLKKYVLQRFVPNDGDFRVLVIGNEVAIIGRRAVEGSHLNNTSQGGEAMLAEADSLPAELIEQCKHISRVLDMEISGVDVLQDKETGGYYFLEVNAQPQLMTGAFLDKKAEMLGTYLAEVKRLRSA